MGTPANTGSAVAGVYAAAVLLLASLSSAQYFESLAAYDRIPFADVPHGNFFNFLPPAPDSAVADMPPQDGSIVWNRTVLDYNRKLYREGHPMAKQVVDALVAVAEYALETPIRTVTNKTFTPPNGNKRYYLSIGPYFWPSEKTQDNPEGLPYVRRDGIFNAELEVKAPDNIWLRDTLEAVKWHALAHFFTGEDKFARQAKDRVYTFFLDPVTGMVPDLRFAQSVPGVTDGRPQGAIDMRHVGDMLDGMRLIHSQDASIWTDEDDQALMKWMDEYTKTYLLTHPLARSERKSENNHGVYLDVQLLSILKYLGRYGEALSVAHYAQHRFAKQVIAGEMPQEFVRQTSVHYLSFTTKAFTKLALQSATLGVDLWRVGLRHGYSMKDVWDFAAPHTLTRMRYWPYRQVSDALSLDRFVQIMPEVYAAYVPSHGERGPYEYLYLNREFWTSEDFMLRKQEPQRRKFLAECAISVKLDSDYALQSLPEPACASLSCDTFSQAVIISALVAFLACLACLGYNSLSFYIAERAPELPKELKELAAQQKRILMREQRLFIQQLAPRAYVSPMFTRAESQNNLAGGAAGTSVTAAPGTASRPPTQ